MKVLVIQTAFLGDVILTLPLVQALQASMPDAEIDMMVIPAARDIAEGSPAVTNTLLFDKKGAERGLGRLFRKGRELRSRSYDTVVTPHRSFRTAVLALMTGARTRVGFGTSALPFVYHRRVRFRKDLHEVDRNLSLLEGLDIVPVPKARPRLMPSPADKQAVDDLLSSHGVDSSRLVAIAPGSVWFTKRWPADRYAQVIQLLDARGYTVVIVGGAEDRSIAEEIMGSAGVSTTLSAAGRLSLLQSADLIGRCRALVTNDSAPMHLAVAMRTRVIALFGPTVPSFGFAPYGEKDIVIQNDRLVCRPCTKHGGPRCPIGTFECMLSIAPGQVVEAVLVDAPGGATR